MNDADNFQFLFDGSEPGWVLQRTVHHRERLRLVFGDRGPTRHEMLSIRNAVPAFAALPASEFVGSVRGRQQLALGDFGARAAEALKGRCAALGLVVAADSHVEIAWLFFNEVDSRALLIEDESLASRLREKAIAGGMPIQEWTGHG